MELQHIITWVNTATHRRKPKKTTEGNSRIMTHSSFATIEQQDSILKHWQSWQQTHGYQNITLVAIWGSNPSNGVAYFEAIRNDNARYCITVSPTGMISHSRTDDA